MSQIPLLSSPLAQAFFAPLWEALAHCPSRRACPSLPDTHWLLVGTVRALHQHPSGRAFLQHLQSLEDLPEPQRGHYFETLKSPRRLALCAEANAQLGRTMTGRVPEAFAGLAGAEALADFDLYAGDGHAHAAAAHDARDEKGQKVPVNHFFRLDLRTHALSHLCLGQGREHDMHALKRMTIEALRHGAPKGRKVLYVWDRAGIDFRQWQRWKQAGIYFLSREKENMDLTVLGAKAFDRTDPCHAGVQRDELVGTSNGVMLRRIVYDDALRAETFEYLTNEMTLAPGILVQLYKMRWDLEKVFDELENRLGGEKAWGSSETAKSQQSQLLCVMHNLLLLYEQTLQAEHGITNQAEEARRAKRHRQAQATWQERGAHMPIWQQALQRLTQRSVKFLRWLRDHLFAPTSCREALRRLRVLYATL